MAGTGARRRRGHGHAQALALNKIQTALGEFGPFQRRTYALIVVPAMFCAMSTLSHVFLTVEPRHRCFVVGCDDELHPVFNETWLPGVIPPDHVVPGRLSSCSTYNYTVTEPDPGPGPGPLPPSPTDSSCIFKYVDTSVNVTCTRRVFQGTVSSVVTEWDLACEGEWVIPMSQSVFFVGILAGSFLFGFLGDLLGRRAAFGIAVFGMGTFGSAVSLAPSYLAYTALRFMTAMCNQGAFMISFVLGMELVGASKRTMCGILIEYVFAFGEILLAGLAYAVPRWRLLQLCISAPALLCLFYFPWIPESVDWLLAEGKHEKAVRVVEWAEQVNGVTIPADAKSDLAPPSQATSASGASPEEASSHHGVDDFRQLFASRILLVRATVVFYLWCVVNFVYYGLSLNTSLLGDNLYLSFVLVAAAEIPGYTLAWILMERWGRKPGLSLSLALGGSAVIVNGLVQRYDVYWLSTSLYVVGKLGGTSAFGIVYVYTAELFPTTVRAATLGVASMFSRIGAILAPFVLTLAEYWDVLPMFVFGALCLVGAALSVTLAETRNCALPQTVEEAESLGRGGGQASVCSKGRLSVGGRRGSENEEAEPLLD